MLSDSQKHLASAILTRSVVVGFHMRSEGGLPYSCVYSCLSHISSSYGIIP